MGRDGDQRAGQIFGISTTPIPSQDWHGFLWEHGRMTDLNASGHVVGWGEATAAINDRGEIVGFSTTKNG